MLHCKCAKQWSKHSTYINPFNTHNNSIRWNFIIPFYRRGNKVFESIHSFVLAVASDKDRHHEHVNRAPEGDWDFPFVPWGAVGVLQVGGRALLVLWGSVTQPAVAALPSSLWASDQASPSSWTLCTFHHGNFYSPLLGSCSWIRVPPQAPPSFHSPHLLCLIL